MIFRMSRLLLTHCADPLLRHHRLPCRLEVLPNLINVHDISVLEVCTWVLFAMEARPPQLIFHSQLIDSQLVTPYGDRALLRQARDSAT